ncbi:MAG: uracil-DNA glycosylase [Dethiobacter sp.]|nr:uracil-DNA glycosylase [Dethiobacter sp.]MBS3898869.1 uracil-DNA glycosylase [Dethiobacter sp.]
MPAESNLESLRRNVAECRECQLGEGRQQMVFGEGPSDAALFLLGEAPGATEDETGRPFVGRAGELLSEILLKAGIERQAVFITGSCKCRPPKNRNPSKIELAACKPILLAQLALIRPQIVVCLGLVATRNFLGPKSRMTDVRGGCFAAGNYLICPTYHPAAVLRGTVKADLLVADLRLVRERLEKR